MTLNNIRDQYKKTCCVQWDLLLGKIVFNGGLSYVLCSDSPGKIVALALIYAPWQISPFDSC